MTSTLPFRGRGSRLLVPVLLAFATACGGGDSSSAPPSDGTIHVAVRTSGDAPDVDGYVVTIDGVQHPIADSGDVTGRFATGRHVVTIGGVDGNCIVTRTGDPVLAGGDSAVVSIHASCAGHHVVLYGGVATAGTRDLWLVTADGTLQRRLTNDAVDQVDPFWTADGQRIVYHETNGGSGELATVRPDGSDRRQLTHAGLAFDDASLSPDGRAVALVVETPGHAGCGIAPIRQLVLVDTGSTPNARQLTHYACAQGPRQVRFSPDGTRLLFDTDTSGHYGIYTLRLADSVTTRLTSDTLPSMEGSWSADGTRIVFVATVGNGLPQRLFTMHADGSAITEVPLTGVTGFLHEPSFSPDGATLAFYEVGPTGNLASYHALRVPASGGAVARLLPGEQQGDAAPAWRPSLH